MDDIVGLSIAIEEAKRSLSEDGIPVHSPDSHEVQNFMLTSQHIGAALVSSKGEVIARSHNMSRQKGSTILHAEMSTFDAAGRIPKSMYNGATLYTTLTPCDMCTGASLWFGVRRVVMGEARSVTNGGHDILRGRGVEVVDMDDEGCYEMLQKYIKDNPEKWALFV